MLKEALQWYINNPRRIFEKMAYLELLNWLPDEQYLRLIWPTKAIGYSPNFTDPQSFNEKLQWLKIHDHNPLYTKLVDKWKVRQYVEEKIGGEYLIPVVGGPWKTVEEIPFETLPDKFVLKCNHDSGGIVICTDKRSFDIEGAKKKLKKALKRNYFWGGREYPYKNVEKIIFAEQYMEEVGTTGINDYKFMMFNGEHKCAFVCTNRFSNVPMNITFFDTEWNRMPFERKYKADESIICKPSRYEEMVEIAKKLSAETVFSRVDLYEINGQVYFGEVTMYPAGGMREFRPIEWDYILGSWINLPNKVGDKE